MELNLGFTIALVIACIILIPLATAVLGGFILGFAGLPGALLSELLASRSEKQRIPLLGLILSTFGQSFLALLWVVIVVGSLHSVLESSSLLVSCIVWFLGFFVATGPAWKAAKTAVRVTSENPIVERVRIVSRRGARVSNPEISGNRTDSPVDVLDGDQKPRIKYTIGTITPFYGAVMTLPITIVGFFVYAFLPKTIAYGWSWVPHF